MTMIDIVPANVRDVAVVTSDSVVLKDMESAVNLMNVIKNQGRTHYFCINAEAVAEEFFLLKDKFPENMLKKFENNGMKFAIFGDISKYTDSSMELQKFIRESNTRYKSFFCADQEDAVKTLSKV